MKTVLHLPQAPSAAPPQGRRVDGWGPTIRLGLVLSVVAAAVAVGIRLATPVPGVALILAVGIVGFALSWHATWHPRPDDDPPP